MKTHTIPRARPSFLLIGCLLWLILSVACGTSDFNIEVKQATPTPQGSTGKPPDPQPTPIQTAAYGATPVTAVSSLQDDTYAIGGGSGVKAAMSLAEESLAAPSQLVATSSTPGTTRLTWTDTPNETSFDIGQFGVAVRSVGANVTKSTFTNLDPGQSIHWYIRSCIDSVCSPWLGPVGKTADGSDTPLPQPTSPVPAVPKRLAATSLEPGEILMMWTDNSANETHFEIGGRRVAANANEALFTNMGPGGSHHFDIRACNANGCSPYHGVVGKTADGSDAASCLPTLLPGVNQRHALTISPEPERIDTGTSVNVHVPFLAEDSSVDQVTLLWIDPTGLLISEATGRVLREPGSPSTGFGLTTEASSSPNPGGQWTVFACYQIGNVTTRMDSASFTVRGKAPPEVNIGVAIGPHGYPLGIAPTQNLHVKSEQASVDGRKIDCHHKWIEGGDCELTFRVGDQLTLTPSWWGGNTVFDQWSARNGPGCTSVVGNKCHMTVTAGGTVMANFTYVPVAPPNPVPSFDPAQVVNQAPTVNAGAGSSIILPDSATLNGTASDDGLPNPPGALSYTWSKVSGSGTVTFANASAPQTSASFSAAGAYVLRLTVSDGELSDNADVTITVNLAPPINQAPTVNAGAGSTITLPANANLNGTASDDGLPNPPGALNYGWTKVSGSGTVTFANASAPQTSASFSAAGAYVLRLTASDGPLSNSADVTITVNPEEPAPIFIDNFDSGRSPAWVDGGGVQSPIAPWTTTGGGYHATGENNQYVRSTVGGLSLTDFEVEVDITNYKEGGIWLRYSGSPTMASGMLLVFRNDDIYWHEVNQNSFGPPKDLDSGSSLSYLVGQEVHIRVVVEGSTYTAYLNHATTPISTLTTASFSSGSAGLYDNSSPRGSQKFDNFQVRTISPK